LRFRRAAFRQNFSICGAPLLPAPRPPARISRCDRSFRRAGVARRSSPRHPCVALQTPEHAPWGPWPRHVPPPRPADSRPDPIALLPAAETLTLTLPDFDTRPDTFTAPPP